MAGIDKNRKNGSYNKFDAGLPERAACRRACGKFIILHYNSLGKKIFANFRKLKIISRAHKNRIISLVKFFLNPFHKNS